MSSSFWTVWTFAMIHIGIAMVLVGVFGEIALEWRHTKGKLAWLTKLCWVLLIGGLVLEFREAARSDNEVIALNKRIEKIDPLNVPIHSVRAAVYLLVRGDFSNDPLFFPNNSITKGSVPISQGDLSTNGTEFVINGKGGAWLILDCDKLETELTYVAKPGEPSNGRMANARRFEMVFNWPGPVMTSQEPSPAFWRFWIDRKNVSTAELDNDGVSASVQFFGFLKGMEVIEGSCDVTINGDVPRKFSAPKIVNDFSADFSTMEKAAP